MQVTTHQNNWKFRNDDNKIKNEQTYEGKKKLKQCKDQGATWNVLWYNTIPVDVKL